MERRLRLLAAGLLLYLSLQGAFGLGWDVEWHSNVGRESFWTPAHLLIYAAVAGTGLVALALVLLDTHRRRAHVTGVDDRSTVSLLGVFHAPLGAFVVGFGSLTLLVAAPLDNYWHELYGIDVTIWAPFHVMGLIGGGVTGLGLVYLLAAEAVRDHRARPTTILGWPLVLLLALLALALLLRTLLVLASPSNRADAAMLEAGPLRVLSGPLLYAPAVVGVSAAAAGMARRPGAATITVALTALIGALIALVTPGLVRWAAGAEGLAFFFPEGPQVSVRSVLSPFLYVTGAVLVDLAYAWARPRRLPAWPVAGLLGSVPVALTALTLTSWRLSLALALPAGALGVAAGLLAANIGGGLGTLLSRNQR
jgi:hypothetical protein